MILVENPDRREAQKIRCREYVSDAVMEVFRETHVVGSAVEMAVYADVDLTVFDDLRKVCISAGCGQRRIVDHEDVLFRVPGIGVLKLPDAELEAFRFPGEDLAVLVLCLGIPGQEPASGTRDERILGLDDIGPAKAYVRQSVRFKEILHLFEGCPPVIVVAARQDLMPRKAVYKLEILDRSGEIGLP